MLVMHFYFVCNMNKIGRIFVFYILVTTTTGAVEFISKFKTSTTTTKWKEPTTTPRWKEFTTKYTYKSPSFTNKGIDNISNNKIKIVSIKAASKELVSNKTLENSTTTERWRQPTERKWQQSFTSKDTPTARSSLKVKSNQGVLAISSFSGTDSRNGRFSSLNGVKIYSPSDSSVVKTDDNENFIVKSVNGKMPMPITITKQGDGVSGTIRILPGSVSVSSSAFSPSKSGPVSSVATYNHWPAPIMKPAVNDFYFPPFPTFPTIPEPMFTRFPDTSFHTKTLDPYPFVRISEPIYDTRIQDPWFNKDKYKQPQVKHNMFRTNWFYPSFNPFFNYW